MFRLSNGKEFSRLVINCFDTTLGYITKSEKGEYAFKLLNCETILHRLMLAGLEETYSSEQVRSWMREHLTVTQNRANRHECYPSWCRTLEDEVCAINGTKDKPARSWHYE